MVYVTNLQNILNRQYVPADRLMPISMAYLSCLNITEKNSAGVCVLDEGTKKISPAFLVNTIITLPWATAFLRIYDWHPTNIIPA